MTKNVALIGATGYSGAAILTELLSRKYHVKAIVRSPEKVKAQENLEIVKVDVFDEEALTKSLAGVDAVISAYNPGWTNPNIFEEFVKGSHNIINATKKAGIKRLLVVGGAGSLYVAPGVQLIDTPQFPKAIYPGANGARVLLDDLKKETELDWTMLSPPIGYSATNPGTRTGKYRIGTDSLLMDGDKPGAISAPDLAIALVDELEKGDFIKARFTIAN